MAALELADPAFSDVIDGHGVDEVQFLAPLTLYGDEVRVLQYRQMLGHGLPGHVESCAQFVQRLSVPAMQPVEEAATAGVTQSPEDIVLTHADIMQPKGCMSRREKGPLRARPLIHQP